MALISTGYNNDLPLGTSYFLRYIKNRIKTKNQNFLAVITGATGTGKSWSGLSFQEQLSPGNDVFPNVFFKARSFMERLNENPPEGTPLLWDELGVDLNAKDWQNLINRVISKVLQTFRRQNLIVFFTVPFLSFVSSDARKLLHAIIKTEKVDEANQETVLRPYLIQVNEDTGQMYKKYLRVAINGKAIPVKRIRLPKPSNYLLQRYEIKKKEFSENLNRDALEQIAYYEEKNTFKPKKPEFTHLQSTCLTLYQRGRTLKEIGKALGIDLSMVFQHLSAARKKMGLEDAVQKNAILKNPKVIEKTQNEQAATAQNIL